MTHWNKKQPAMSLVFGWLGADTRCMTNHHQPQSASKPGFSAPEYRRAMGPGYQVATFREQPILMGEAVIVTSSGALPEPLRRPRRVRRTRRFRLWLPLLPRPKFAV